MERRVLCDMAVFVHSEEIHNPTEPLTDGDLALLLAESATYEWKTFPVSDANDRFRACLWNVAEALRWAGLLPTVGDEEWLPERYDWLMENAKCKPTKPKAGSITITELPTEKIEVVG